MVKFEKRYKLQGWLSDATTQLLPKSFCYLFACITLFCWLGITPPAEAGVEDSSVVVGNAKLNTLLLQMAGAEGTERKEVLEAMAKTGDPRLEAVFADFAEGSLYRWKDIVVVCKQFHKVDGQMVGTPVDPWTRQAMTESGDMGKELVISQADFMEIAVGRRDRGWIRDALTLLRLRNPNPEARLNAVIRAGDGTQASMLATLEELAQTEKVSSIKRAFKESQALIALRTGPEDATGDAQRIKAAGTLGELRSSRALASLKEMSAKENNPATKQVYGSAIQRIERWATVVQWIGNIFSGLSLSSILILMALGLSIIFGLMGVINMAHGALMMIGAYATYGIQVLFVHNLPASVFDGYFIVAIPASFFAAALVGVIIEATVIRFLYGRPLETLLATWGVSLLLVQIIRNQVGDNTAVNSPSWLQGSLEIMQDVRLPYNRLFIIAFCGICIALMYYVVERTRLGLLLRATTQNRPMAACLGVSTRRIDALTFGLGAGLAGLAGCALTQIGGVTPDMGDNYIVDSFMVVVTGGVGKLAGAIWTGLGLGISNKLLEPLFETVWAKVIILALVVMFIQWRPSGLFPAKGRTADV